MTSISCKGRRQVFARHHTSQITRITRLLGVLFAQKLRIVFSLVRSVRRFVVIRSLAVFEAQLLDTRFARSMTTWLAQRLHGSMTFCQNFVADAHCNYCCGVGNSWESAQDECNQAAQVSLDAWQMSSSPIVFDLVCYILMYIYNICVVLENVGKYSMSPQFLAASISLLKRPHGPFFPSVTRDLSVWCWCQGNTPNVDVSKTIELKKRLGCKPFVYFLHRFRKAHLRPGQAIYILQDAKGQPMEFQHVSTTPIHVLDFTCKTLQDHNEEASCEPFSRVWGLGKMGVIICSRCLAEIAFETSKPLCRSFEWKLSPRSKRAVFFCSWLLPTHARSTCRAACCRRR